MFWYSRIVSQAVGAEPPRQYPFWLFGRNEPDGLFGRALRSFLGFDLRLEPILIAVNIETTDLIDGLLYGRHWSLRARFEGPRVGLRRLSRCRGSGSSSAGHPVFAVCRIRAAAKTYLNA